MNRLQIFLGVFAFFAILETFIGAQPRKYARLQRWPGNLGLILIANLIIKFAFPLGLAGFALFVTGKGWGLFNIFNISFEFFISLVMLDFFIWGQHVLTHKISLLWKLHRVHHTDVDLDVSSALRFHPLEIIFSIIVKALLILTFGFKAESILVFEVILNSCAMFNHANIKIPSQFEKIMRYLIVTPQMHLIHHNTKQKYSDTNYGFNLSLWDRLFKTYTEDQGKEFVIGQRIFRSPKQQTFRSLLIQPFQRS